MARGYEREAETPYAETEALLAVMEEDDTNAALILHDMTGTELKDFRLKVEALLMKIKVEQDIRKVNRKG